MKNIKLKNLYIYLLALLFFLFDNITFIILRHIFSKWGHQFSLRRQHYVRISKFIYFERPCQVSFLKKTMFCSFLELLNYKNIHFYFFFQSYVNDMEQYFVRYIKEKTCYTALSYKDELDKYSKESLKHKIDLNSQNNFK